MGMRGMIITDCGLRVVAMILCAGVNALAAAPPEDQRLAQIRRTVDAALDHIPDYTCLETIHRTEANPPDFKVQHADIVRLEVAHVGGRELFALPGAGSFTDQPPAKLVGWQGLTSTGEFSQHLHIVFGSLETDFVAVGQEELDGRAALRYDFLLQEPPGCWQIVLDGIPGVAGCRGSFWVDAASLQLLLFEVHPSGISSAVPLKSAYTRIEYGRVRIGDSEVLLPRKAEAEMVNTQGRRQKNVIEFSHCRQYAGTPAISFAEPESGAITNAPVPALSLREGLKLRVQLESDLDLATVAPGAGIQARVAEDALAHGVVAVPKGALLDGRIRRVTKETGAGRQALVTLEFFAIESAGQRLPFYAYLESVGPLPGLRLPRNQESEAPGVCTLLLARGRSRLPRGLGMVWRVTDLRR